jgi:hypothetical protein
MDENNAANKNAPFSNKSPLKEDYDTKDEKI